MGSDTRQGAVDQITCDVAVVGGGLSGLAASIQLAKAGFHVCCFEPVRNFEQIVGESLDWSSPALLRQIGFPMEELIHSQTSTYKRRVILKLPDEVEREYVPPPRLGAPPLNFELRTIHVDRLHLHHGLMQLAAAQGVSIIHDRVTGIERNGRIITGIRTADDLRIHASWFIDASGGAASLFAREFQVPSVTFGPRKVAMWTHFKASEWQESTTLYAEAYDRSYMQWVWEIPIHPGMISVGYVTTGEDVKRKREQSLSVEQIYARQLMKFTRFRTLLQDNAIQGLNVTSFTCRVFRRVCGPNWIIIGEAASIPDPITSNGVTAALRHAIEGAQLISRFRNRGRISWWAQTAYDLRVLHMGSFFNSLIEKLAYDWPIRDRIGLSRAGDIYTVPAWGVNQIYSLFQPDGMLSSGLLSLFLASLRSAAWLFYHSCKLFSASPHASLEGGSIEPVA